MAGDSEHPHHLGREEILAQLKDLEPGDFASRYLLDRVPWLFANRHQYIDWKTSLAEDLEVDPFMLVVVGSAGLGFSLAPYKGFAAFGPLSDIDVAVVSQRHFDEAWRWLRELGTGNLLERDKLERDMFNWHRRNLVFDGAIATEKLLRRLPFGVQWASALGYAGKREPTVGRAVKIRLYRDFESLRTYHVTNIREWKLKLVAGEVDAPPATLRGLDGGEGESHPEGKEAVA
jgi:hypothetical protein